jgi:hypothetical protein
VAAAPLSAPPRGRHRRDVDGGICDLRRIIMYLIGETVGMLATGHRTEVTGSRTGPGQRGRECRLPVRAVLALGACRAARSRWPAGRREITAQTVRPRPGGRSRSAPEGPAGGTRARGR